MGSFHQRPTFLQDFPFCITSFCSSVYVQLVSFVACRLDFLITELAFEIGCSKRSIKMKCKYLFQVGFTETLTNDSIWARLKLSVNAFFEVVRTVINTAWFSHVLFKIICVKLMLHVSLFCFVLVFFRIQHQYLKRSQNLFIVKTVRVFLSVHLPSGRCW